MMDGYGSSIGPEVEPIIAKSTAEKEGEEEKKKKKEKKKKLSLRAH